MENYLPDLEEISVLKTTYWTLVINANVQAVEGLTALACSIISNLASLNIRNLILFLLDTVNGNFFY